MYLSHFRSSVALLFICIAFIACSESLVSMSKAESDALDEIGELYSSSVTYRIGTGFDTEGDENGLYVKVILTNDNMTYEQKFAPAIAMILYNALPDNNKSKFSYYKVELVSGSNVITIRFTPEELDALKERIEFSTDMAKLFVNNEIEDLCDKLSPHIDIEKDSCLALYYNLRNEHLINNSIDFSDQAVVSISGIKYEGIDDEILILLHYVKGMQIETHVSRQVGSEKLYTLYIIVDEPEKTKELDEV